MSKLRQNVQAEATMKIVVVLAVQWGYPGDRVERWFHINPYNHSGRRLIGLVGHPCFKVTNACSDIVYNAGGKGTPDAEWLRRNLAVLKPELVLVCGSVAQRTFQTDMVNPDAQVLKLPHPAARMWTKSMVKRWARRIQTAQRKMWRKSMNIRPYTDAMRKQGGWIKQYDSRGGGCRVVEFQKKLDTLDGERCLVVQLWDDGKHRATFFLNGCMSTTPTGFATVPEMLDAIEIETKRKQSNR